jgi:hypothetical protein
MRIDPLADPLTLTHILLALAFLGILANIIGSGTSAWLLWRDHRVILELQEAGINSYRQRLANEMFRDECVRFWVQFSTLLLRVPAFLIDPSRYSGFVNDLWALTLVSSSVGLTTAVLFMWRSLAKEQTRRYILRTVPPEYPP